jgi:2-alkyl-3-oxoalkanoate reductase
MQEPAKAPLAAVTGATGFIGRRLVPLLANKGWRVRLLIRRDPTLPEWRDVRPQVVAGGLSDQAALARLVEDARVVIHLAGLIKAARHREYYAVNRDGAAAVASATIQYAPQARFLLVSTLAAREPQLSDYAASKRAGEDAVRDIAGARTTVLRPTAVYGPADRETLMFFQLAQRRWIPLPGSPDARMTMIHVEDLVSLIGALAADALAGDATDGTGSDAATLRPATVTACDARAGGYSWDEILTTAAHAVGNSQARLFRAPGSLLRSVALTGDLARALGVASMVSSQKLREIQHRDWSVHKAELARIEGWAPRFTLEAGFANTVAWYRAAGWLPPAKVT